MKKCTSCGNEKDYSLFYKNKLKKDGYSSACKICCDVSNKKTRNKNIDKTRKHRKNNRQKIVDYIQEYKSNLGCFICKENESCCLDLHHVEKTTKSFDPSQATSIKKFVEESKKCVVLCANCHRKLHANIICL